MRSGRRIFIKGVSSAAIGAGIVSGCPTPTKKETSKESSHSGVTSSINKISKKHMVQIREKEYQFYEQGSDYLMIRCKVEDAVASNVIVTTSPGTKNLSFNMGSASASCELQDK